MQCPICEAEISPSDTICHSCGAAVPRENAKPAASGLMLGAKLGGEHFAIGKVLGKGGFGITYLGSDLKLRRSVAIKELYPSGCVRVGDEVRPGGNWPAHRFETAKQKFLQEAQTLAQFQHPNICAVHASFEENGTAYMVMEYIKGQTLHQILKEHGKLDEQSAINCVLQLAEALRTIHAANVLHRDIKPANILLAEDGRIVLIDFGTAREYAGDVIKHMTMMLTPGYAPIEQYTQQGKLGPWTDIYASGATLYHLLTGQQPIAATDQANGAILVPPRQLNPAVSQQTSDAVMWAMQMAADQRPQTIDDFLDGLAGKSLGPVARFTQGVGRGGAVREGQGENPYKERIEAILAELEAGTPQPPPSSHDEEIDKIAAQLKTLTGKPTKSFPHCPACGESAVKEATGEKGEGTCPICKNAKLDIRELPLRRCPVCRDGALESHQTEPNSTLCPVCRNANMAVEKRRKFGLAIDEWLVCPDCHAEMNHTGGGVKLARVKSDPLGNGRKYLDQTMPLADWRKIAGRREKYLECPSCHAQLDANDDKTLTLTHVASDPHGTGAKMRGAKLTRGAWATLAEGLDPADGNASCPSCSAAFNIDHDRSEITVIKSDEKAYPWSAKMVGKAFALKAWYLSEAGKRSMVPGYICGACKTEFDKAENVLKLMWTPPGPLAGHEGQQHTAEGWQRIAVGLPTKSEESKLRDRLTKLHIVKQESLDHYFKEEANYQANLRTELDELIRKAFVIGQVPILLKDERIFLLDDETLYWESPARRHQLMKAGGQRSWTFETRGVLALTNQRILFDNRHTLWQQTIDDIMQISIEDGFKSGGMVVVAMRDSPPIGFEIQDATFTVTTEFSSHTIRANPRDLVLLTTAVKKRVTGGEPADSAV